MGQYLIEFTKQAKEDLSKIKFSGQRKLIQKIEKLIAEIEIDPKEGTGKPEELKGFGGNIVFSWRIDQKHRLVYRLVEEEKRVEILSTYGHYDDK